MLPSGVKGSILALQNVGKALRHKELSIFRGCRFRGVDSSKMKRKTEYLKSEAGLRNSAAAKMLPCKDFCIEYR